VYAHRCAKRSGIKARRECAYGQYMGWKAQGKLMPFVNIRILEGHSQQRKNEIARRVTEAISEVAELPREAVWVVFEDVTPTDWYVSGTPVAKPRD
jgi:4-oxalocrotonate tautomerase